ncbi:MAG: DsrE family protein [Alphaproteobacteria bacterium]
MSDGKQKFVLLVTHGPEDPETATIPFVMATTAQALDKEVLMGFQSKGVFLMMKGMADHVAACGFPALTDLMNAYVEGGGKMYVCGPCMEARKISEDELIEGASVVGAATFVAECAEAENVLVY